MFSSFVSLEPQYGQRKTADCSCTSVGADASRGAGGANPATRSFSRPSGVILSDDHESSEITRTSGSPPSSRTFSAIASRITSSAGQPRNVGVNSTRTSLAVDRDVAHDTEVDEGDHRDLRVGDLGECLPDCGLGHHVAPGMLRRTIVISLVQLAQLVGVLPALDGVDLCAADALRERSA